MAEKPKIADTKPIRLELAEGHYYWCACGRSSDQPFCDGSHRGSSFAPVRFEIEEQKMRAYCTCKQTKTPPFCDGSHKSL